MHGKQLLMYAIVLQKTKELDLQMKKDLSQKQKGSHLQIIFFMTRIIKDSHSIQKNALSYKHYTQIIITTIYHKFYQLSVNYKYDNELIKHSVNITFYNNKQWQTIFSLFDMFEISILIIF